MILLDTSIVIDYLRGKTETVDYIDRTGKGSFALNSLVIMELFVGARNKIELNQIKRELSGFNLMEINQQIADLATEIIANLGLSSGISIPDAFIAASALIYDVELKTLNLKDFRSVPGLNVSRDF